MQIQRQRKPTIRMEMSPLIDCVFLLLIFFMLSSTFLAPKIQLDLPKAAAQPTPSQNDPVIVSIDSTGELFVNNHPATWQELELRLRPLVAEAEQKVVTIRCDDSAEHRHFVRVLDAAKGCGAEHVNVAYQQQATAISPKAISP